MYRPNPKRLGHLVLKVRDIRKSFEFYTQVVGLQLSDWISDEMVFLRAGTDHHDLALAQMPEGTPAFPEGTAGLEHFSYLVEDYAEIEKATAMLQQRGVPIERGPGKHGPGENCFIVFKDPDGHNVEFYCDMVQITPENPYEPKIWDNDLDSFDQWHCEKFVVPPPPQYRR